MAQQIDSAGGSDIAMEISFVLPCLDEAPTIGQCVKECLTVIRSSGVRGEVVVADNGSTDGSREIATQTGARVVQVSTRGYGSALMAGIRAARGKYVLIGDSDMSYDFSQMPRFLQELERGNDVVVGCRVPRGGGTIQPGAMPFLHRWFGNPLLSLLGRVFFRVNIIDFHCGIRAFRRDCILRLGLQTTGMEFASEMIVKASLAKLRIGQVPVTLRPDARKGPPHLRTWHDGWRHLRFMLLHAPRWLFLYPGLAMTAFSMVVFIALLFGPVEIGKVRFDTNTLLMATVGILVGFEIMLLGLFSEVFSRRFGLLPPSELSGKILRVGPFEKGLLAGGIMFCGGLFCLFIAFLKWRSIDYGNLSYPDTLRLIIPAVTCMSLGIEIIFGGFLLAVLDLVAPTRD